MYRLLKRCCVLLYAAPAIALASPVVITTHSTGTAKALPDLLYTLGMDRSSGLQDLPYEMTLSSTYDLPQGSVSILGEYNFIYSSDIVVDFRLGDMHYHSSGLGSSAVRRSSSNGYDSYEHEIQYLPINSPWSYSITQTGILTLPSLGPEGALELRELGPTPVVAGAITIAAYPATANEPVGPTSLLGSSMAALSVQVMSPVPEPAPFVLLAAGLLTLALRRRFGWTPPTATRHDVVMA
jgi:hypothetical protein